MFADTSEARSKLAPSRAAGGEPPDQIMLNLLTKAIRRLIPPKLPALRAGETAGIQSISLVPTASMGGIDSPLAAFQSEEAAYRFIERCVWPDIPVCPHCGEWGHAGRLNGNSTRVGTWKCYRCRKPFSVKVGTPLESSHVPMRKWLRAILLLYRNDQPADVNSLGRILNVTPRTAAHILQRLQSLRSRAMTGHVAMRTGHRPRRR